MSFKKKIDDPIKSDLIMRYYHIIPKDIVETSNPELYNEIADFMNEKSQGLNWSQILSTLQLFYISSIGLSLEYYEQNKEEQTRRNLK